MHLAAGRRTCVGSHLGRLKVVLPWHHARFFSFPKRAASERESQGKRERARAQKRRDRPVLCRTLRMLCCAIADAGREGGCALAQVWGRLLLSSVWHVQRCMGHHFGRLGRLGRLGRMAPRPPLLPPPLFGGDESSHSLVKIPCIRSPASLYDLFLPLFLTMTVTVTMRQPENRAAESTAVSVSGPQVPAPAPFRRPRERGSPARDATNNEGPVRLPGLPSLPGLPAFQSGGVGLGVAGTRLPAVGELTASLPPPASASSAAAHHPHGHPHAGVQGPTPLTLHPPPLLPPLSQQHQLPQNHHQHQHHPSSSITNTGARTPDSLHADPAFLSSALPEGKSRTLQGPSAKDWARHRETIIELYRQYPLKKVSELMRKHHGFSAR